ncbi:MAG: putative phosphatase [uncultured archaeon A07HB70]|nr:MAG: putative phosphatase [uncultured archaeon A07HB70]
MSSPDPDDLPGYDFWLFDLDGTLVDADWTYARSAFDRAGERLGREFTDHEAALLWHGLAGERNTLLRRLGVDPPAFWRALHAAERPAERAAATRLHPDAAFVADLDVPTGVVTHCQPFLAEPVLSALCLDDALDVVVCCSDETGWKPDPGPVDRALAGLDVERGDRGVLAGDMPSDVGAAWAAGLDAVHVERHGPDRRGYCVRADYRVSSFAELASS